MSVENNNHDYNQFVHEIVLEMIHLYMTEEIYLYIHYYNFDQLISERRIMDLDMIRQVHKDYIHSKVVHL
jgi:hypothetical protein